MLKVRAAIGNIFLDRADLKDGDFERLEVSRMELEKRILRRKGNCGTDIGINLDSDVKLCHGDVIDNGDTKIIIEQLPEKVISVRLKTKNPSVLILVGHIIGNRHRPISIHEDEIFFPIQADSEKDVFTKLFHSVISYIEITVNEQIFSPQSGADIHEH